MTTSSRTLDARIAEHVMGAVCIHHMVVCPYEMVLADEREAFKRDYGVDAPEGWTGDASFMVEFSDYPPKYCDKCGKRDHETSGDITRSTLPQYSTDLKAAWAVIEKMREEWRPVIDIERSGTFVVFANRSDENETHTGRSKNAAEAICLAALEAIGESQ